MGFFSFKTNDTNRSIPNVHSSNPTFAVTLIDNNGNKWHEPAYQGYGDFGGKDIFELIDEMNGGSGNRERGIDLYYQEFKNLGSLFFPNLVENANVAWENKKPKRCPNQGVF